MAVTVKQLIVKLLTSSLFPPNARDPASGLAGIYSFESLAVGIVSRCGAAPLTLAATILTARKYFFFLFSVPDGLYYPLSK
jgi:hypothetical protein